MFLFPHRLFCFIYLDWILAVVGKFPRQPKTEYIGAIRMHTCSMNMGWPALFGTLPLLLFHFVQYHSSLFLPIRSCFCWLNTNSSATCLHNLGRWDRNQILHSNHSTRPIHKFCSSLCWAAKFQNMHTKWEDNGSRCRPRLKKVF